MRILAISGSLRAASSNTRVIEALARLAPAEIEVVVHGGLGDLPHFNFDLEEGGPPPAVAALRQAVGLADGLVLCSPEYAHSVAGVMKNALDWLVPSLEFPQKPVALLNASPRAHHAQAHIRETLVTMQARMIDAACIDVPLQGRSLDTDQIVADPALASLLREALWRFAEGIAGPA